MSFIELGPIVTVLNTTKFIVSEGIPVSLTTRLMGTGIILERGSVNTTITRAGLLKLIFSLTNDTCAKRHFVFIDPKEPNNSPENTHQRLRELGIALVSSVIEGLKPYIFQDINIAKAIEEASANGKNGTELVFSTLRLPTNVENQIKYSVAVFSHENKTSNYSSINTLTFSITRNTGIIVIEISSDRSSSSDTIATKAIMERVLGALNDNEYIIESFDPAFHNGPGKWSFIDFKNN